MKNQETKELEGKPCGWGGRMWRIKKVDQGCAMIVSSTSGMIVPAKQLLVAL